MAYLIEHLDCVCHDRTRQVCITPEAVALSLWSRDVAHHVVWAGECPYQFYETNVCVIQALLEECPPAAVRDLLPCAMWAGSQVLVVIGRVNRDERQPLREVSYLSWLDACHARMLAETCRETTRKP